VIETLNLQGGADTVIGLFWDDHNDDWPDLVSDKRDDKPGASRLEWTANESGIRWIKVRDQDPSIAGAQVKYDIKITKSVAETPPILGDSYETDDDFTQATEIGINDLGQTHTFHQPGDEDWVKFEAQAGYHYVIETLNLQGGADTVIGLFWSDGIDGPELVDDLRDDSAGPSRIEWTADQSGTRWVKIRDRDPNKFGLTVAYTIRISAELPQGRLYLPFGPDAGDVRVSRTGLLYKPFYDAAGLVTTSVPCSANAYCSGPDGEYHDYTDDDLHGDMLRGAIDFSLPYGQPVLAAAPGKVAKADACGVEVLHLDGKRAYYLHLSAVHVRSGDQVVRGQHIGNVGATCGATGPHLHFALWDGTGEVIAKFADTSVRAHDGVIRPSRTGYQEYRYRADGTTAATDCFNLALGVNNETWGGVEVDWGKTSRSALCAPGNDESRWQTGTEVYLRATPNTGYHLVRWDGLRKTIDSELVFVSMDEDRNITAAFVRDVEPCTARNICSPRNTIIAELGLYKDTVKNVLIWEVDLYAKMLAKQQVTLMPQVSDYGFLAFDLITGDLSLNKLKKVGDRQFIEGIMDLVDIGVPSANLLRRTLKALPSDASETEIHNKVLEVIWNEADLFDGLGAADTLRVIDRAYEDAIDNLPDPLPDGYPANRIIQDLRTATKALESVARIDAVDVKVPSFADSTSSVVPFGIINGQYLTLLKLANQYSEVEQGNAGMSWVKVGIYGVGALVKVGIAWASGGFSLASELLIWGRVKLIDTFYGLAGTALEVTAISTDISISTQIALAHAQVHTDAAMLVSMAKDAASLVQPSAVRFVPSLSSSQIALTVDSVKADDLILSNESIGAGRVMVEIRNSASVSKDVTVYGTILAETDYGMAPVHLLGSQSISVPANTTEQVILNYAIVRSSQYFPEGFIAQVNLISDSETGNALTLGPYSDHFFVGGTAYVSAFRSATYETFESPFLADSEIYSTTITTPSLGKILRIYLDSNSSQDFDLHVYDQAGNHVGIDYVSGKTDLEIANARYSGDSTVPEWFEIESSSEQILHIVVKPVLNLPESQVFISKLVIPKIDPLIEVSPLVRAAVESSGQPVDFSISVYEASGQGDVTDLAITLSDFENPGGVIGASGINCQPPVPNSVPSGQSVRINCSGSVTTALPAGIYTATATITGRSSTASSLVATSTVILSLESNVLFGDVSCDQQVNSIDALFILQYGVALRGVSNACPLPQNTLLLSACDVNGDGNCSLVDALFVLQCNVGIANAFCSGNQATMSMGELSENASDAAVRADTTIVVGAKSAEIDKELSMLQG
jgi:hypothetical protein